MSGYICRSESAVSKASAMLGLLKLPNADLAGLGALAAQSAQLDLICLMYPKHIDTVPKSAIETGLNHPDSTVRKQTFHLLQQLGEQIVSRDFITAFEVLDVQKEYHLVDQVWPIMVDFVQTGPFEWIFGLLKRILATENVPTRRQMIISLLDIHALPATFVYRELLPTLNDSSLFKNAMFEIEAKTKAFFTAFLTRRMMQMSEACKEYFEATDQSIFIRSVASPRAIVVFFGVFHDIEGSQHFRSTLLLRLKQIYFCNFHHDIHIFLHRWDKQASWCRCRSWEL